MFLVAALLSLQLSVPRDTIVIPDRVNCVPCKLSVQRLGSAGSSDDSISHTARDLHLYTLLRSPREDLFLLRRNHGTSAVLVYDAAGVLRRAIGRSGQGPGEFNSAWAMAFVAPDTVVVFDQSTKRMNWFTAAGAFVRSATLPLSPVHAIALPDRSFILLAESRASAHAGLLLHHVSAEGRLLRSFHKYEAGSANTVNLPFSIATNPRGGFVLLDHGRLTMTFYDAQLRVTQVLRRDAGWRKAPIATKLVHSNDPYHEPTTRVATEPFPFVRSIFMDSEGLVWIGAATARAGWRDSSIEFHPLSIVLPGLTHRFWTGLVEVIDPVRHHVVFRGNVAFVGEHLNDGSWAVVNEDEFGSMVVVLHRMSLVR